MLNGRTYVISAFIDAISIIIHVRNYYLTHIYNIFFHGYYIREYTVQQYLLLIVSIQTKKKQTPL